MLVSDFDAAGTDGEIFFGKMDGVRGEVSRCWSLFSKIPHFDFETVSGRLNGNTKPAQFSDFFDTLVAGGFGFEIEKAVL